MKKRVLVSWIAFNADFKSGVDVVNVDGPHVELHNHIYKDATYEKHIILSASNQENDNKCFVLSKFIGNRFNRRIEIKYLDLESVIDVELIKPKVTRSIIELINDFNGIDIFISPGTPAMQVVWYLIYWELGKLSNNIRLFQTTKSALTKDNRPKQIFIDLTASTIPQSIQLKQVGAFHKKQTDLIIGEEIKPTYELAQKVAATDRVSVVILGETGAGKERLSKFIHDNSVRKDKPFVAVNCGAIPNDLIESELFGHEKGAFTSANKMHIGKFEQANKGTIFLDEIGDMPLRAQTKLLRVLQPEQKIVRVGGTKEISIDVRLIAATNKNLKEMCAQGLFRYDLYYRLNVVELNIVPLRFRRKDLKELLHYFIKMKAVYFGKEQLTIEKEAVKQILNYSFLGNTRELINLVEYMYVFCDKLVSINDLPAYITDSSNSDLMNLEQVKARHIQHVLEVCNGNMQRASDILGISRNTLKKYLNI